MNVNARPNTGVYDNSDPRLEHLGSIISDSYALESELRRLSHRIYPAPELKELIDAGLLPVNSRLRGIFTDAYDRITNNPGWRPSTQLIAAQRLWMEGFLHRIVRSISSADIKSHPLEIMTIISFWLDKAGIKECGVMTTPKDQLNFSIAEIWSTVAAYLRSEVGVDPGVTRKYVNLSFPSLYKDNALMSGIYAHELGHFLDNQLSLWEEVFAKHVPGHPQITELLTVLAHSGRPHSPAQLITSLRDGILGSWIRELVADTFGILLLGPAFFFAANMIDSHEYFQNTLIGSPPVDVLAPSHPSTSLRVEYRVQLLEDFGYLEKLSDVIRDRVYTIASWWKNADAMFWSGQRPKPVPHDVRIIESILRDCIPHIASVVSNAAADLQFLPEKLFDAEKLARDRLAHLIPPNELGERPVEPAIILNAGWYVYFGQYEIQRLDQSESHDNRNERMQVLQGLLRYSLYASHIHRRWNQL